MSSTVVSSFVLEWSSYSCIHVYDVWGKRGPGPSGPQPLGKTSRGDVTSQHPQASQVYFHRVIWKIVFGASENMLAQRSTHLDCNSFNVLGKGLLIFIVLKLKDKVSIDSINGVTPTSFSYPLKDSASRSWIMSDFTCPIIVLKYYKIK